ncbi:SseB family protein [Paeniglutamicibacter cryotolerans]|uniref:SseB protein N-terminal domain-containing protein n=1 Tax=Paeniglutamicibacter cryotolerans TaxID=670079 RepID=A0A839QK40_9MICC|nr:SseB family protein [Paeniglutamicibacter cryotolerans]MBB2996200.1 hypothetical protein [Paeniglutamicibacter cryotolerans]
MTAHDHSASRPAGTATPKHLPGHISAALARAGGGTDSAGQDWAGRDLSGEGNPLHNFDADDGRADSGYLAAIGALIAGTGTEQEVHAALATARVFIAVVAQLAEGGLGEHGFTEDKEADMALVTLTAPDGRTALPVFTTVENLQSWHAEARPVAVYAPRAALSAVSEEAQMLVIDPGADFTFVLRRPGMWALAQQQDWLPSYTDESLLAILHDLAAGESAIAGISLAPGHGVGSRTGSGQIVPGGGPGPELRLEITFRAGTLGEDARESATRIQAALAGNAVFAEAVDSLELALTAEPGRGGNAQ